jgi:CheY-like chemotaxis protein
VVTSQRSRQAALLSLFTEEGYAATCVSSLEEALAALEQRSFVLILTDLHAGVSRHAFTPAQILRRRAKTTPVGLLTTEEAVLEEAPLAGFAFALPFPVEVPYLLTQIAANLHRELSPLEQRQALRITGFLEAWGGKEWTSLLRLCTDEILCYPASLFPQAPGAPGQGKLALLRLVRAFRQRYQSVRLEVEGIFGRPQGLAVSYYIWVARFEEGWEGFSGATLFTFEGEQICQIGKPLDDQQQRGLQGFPGTFLGQSRSS